jgi:myo-inositol-1(or 4)-monophosphatase
LTHYSIGKKLTCECGKLIAGLYTKKHTIQKKGEIDLVTEADLLCEKMFIEGIKKAFPSHSILSEECGSIEGDLDHLWIIDPIDGTTNYARNLPFFCISVGFAYKQNIQFGFVYAPILNSFFEAELGKGAFLNNEPIHVTDHEILRNSFLTTGFPYNIREKNSYDNIGLFSHFSKNSLAVRRLGSAAIDLCYVAMGTFDGYWEIMLHPWDFAAGKVILEEAGGKITDFKGNSLSLQDSEILATNSKLHAIMLKDIDINHGKKID